MRTPNQFANVSRMGNEQENGLKGFGG